MIQTEHKFDDYYMLAPPPTGLYFMLNGSVYLPGASALISDIGPQPDNRSDPGSTLVCVTINVNTACCRKNYNNALTNATAGAVGEWYYPNSTLVPRHNGNVTDFARIGYTHQVQLARAVSDSTPPPGVYTCQVPCPVNRSNFSAIITLVEKSKFLLFIIFYTNA